MMIIIDTLNRAAPGADENSSFDMGKNIAGATALQVETGGPVVIVHHSGKESGRGMRGHSSLHAAQDAVLEVKRNEGGAHTLTLVKSKDGEDGISHGFNLVTLELGNDESGKLMTSCAVEEVDGIFTTKQQNEPRGANQKAILSAVREILVQRRLQSSAGYSEEITLDEVLTEIKDVLTEIGPKHRQSRTKEALDALIRQGYLTISGNLLALPSTN